MDQRPDDQPDLLKVWLNTLQAAWRAPDRGAGHAAEPESARMLRLWLQALTNPSGVASFAEGLARLLGASETAADPVRFWTTWYERHGEALAGALDELMRSPAFVRASARALDDYASAFAAQRRTAEQAARSLPFATHHDVTRVARMLVALEAKIDRLAEQEQPGVGARETDALGQEVAALAGRLERIEAKVDRLVAAQAAAASAPRRRNADAKAGVSETSQAASTSRKRVPARERQRQVRLVGGGPAR